MVSPELPIALSARCQAALVRAIALLGHSDISVLALQVGLDGRAVGSNRTDRALALVRAIGQDLSPDEASKVLAETTQERLRALSWQQNESDEGPTLARALEADGYVFDGSRLLPANPGPVAVHAEISSLEADLESRGFATALIHYRQSVDNFVAANFEAANGQLRSACESFFIAACTQRTGKELQDANAALQHLRSAKWLDDGEWNHARSFWAEIQDNGPHHGLTSRSEALFRLHVATAILRYLLQKE